MSHELRLHQFLPASRANGPGVRAVIWVQGCSLGCPGCFNPETHAFTGSQQVAVEALLGRILALKETIEGITISGGEPLQQRTPLQALLERVREETNLSVLLFTGFSWQEIQRMPDSDALLASIDVLSAGRYDASQHLARDLRGSTNKTLHFLTDRYHKSDLEAIPPAEVIISPEGEMIFSGIDPVRW